MFVRKILLASAALLLTASANAVIINFDTCQSSCPNVGAMQGDTIETLATLEYTDNGAGGVDFVLTNTISNRYPGDSSSFISELFFGGNGAPSLSNLSSNIDSISYSGGGFTNAGISFNWDVNLANSGGPSSQRIVDGDTASWTANGVSVADFFLPAMVHFQALSTNGGSVKIVGTNTPPQPVPAPAALGLLLLGMMGLRLRQQR